MKIEDSTEVFLDPWSYEHLAGGDLVGVIWAPKGLRGAKEPFSSCSPQKEGRAKKTL